MRSLITLKALTYEPTGGIVAAATTSLPEALGGNRNWDYRYCWLRDATLTLESLMRGGYYDEAMAWRDWLLRAWPATSPSCRSCTARPASVGSTSGRPMAARVRGLGPGAHRQRRLGAVPARRLRRGHVGALLVGATPRACTAGPPGTCSQLIEFVEKGWREPDDGIWEVRGPRRHFTHSKVMAWVAVDRAVRTLEEWPELEGPLDKWRALRDEIFTEVCEKGYNEDAAPSPSTTARDQLDASVLMIPLVGFLPAERPPGGRAPSRRSSASSSTTASCCATARATTAPWTA